MRREGMAVRVLTDHRCRRGGLIGRRDPTAATALPELRITPEVTVQATQVVLFETAMDGSNAVV